VISEKFAQIFATALPEARRVLTWGAIGVVNTLIHLSVVIGLVEQEMAGPVIANGCAFAAANIFSYFANSRFTFRATFSGIRYAKFLVVSLIGVSVSMGVSQLAELMNWHYLIGVSIGFVALPALTYLSHRFWTWRN
jgi:putative flippase GtrA